jgi:hypothetical protein
VFTLDSVSVSLRNADPGLVLSWSPTFPNGITFSLDEGDDPYTTALFQVGTSENALNFDDLVPYVAIATLSFSTPDMAGHTFGLSGAAWFGRSFGYVVWDNPLLLAFGTEGLLEVSLSNAVFGLPGSDTVSATFDLVREDTGVHGAAQVPEPATLGLLAIGLAACVGRRRVRGRRPS